MMVTDAFERSPPSGASGFDCAYPGVECKLLRKAELRIGPGPEPQGVIDS
jgi:hypothetical protein